MAVIVSVVLGAALLHASAPVLPSELTHGLGPLGPLSVKGSEPVEGMAEAHAQAQAIIQKAGAADVFDDATVGPVTALRHKQSGMVCGFSHDLRNSVRVYPATPRGNDVVCDSWRNAGELDSLYFTRLPAGVTTAQAFASVMKDVRNTHADLQPAKGAFADATSRDPAVPPHMTARFVFGTERGPAFGRTSVAMIDGWMVQQRISAPVAEQASVDSRAELDFAMELSLMPKLGRRRP